MTESCWSTARLAVAGDKALPNGPLLQPFPEPPQRIASSLSQLHHASTTALDDDRMVEVGQWPRPWDPASCQGQTRRELWQWLDQVAIWVNTQHLWGVDHPGIPPCWPRHPHLVHDLAVLAAVRYLTQYALSPMPLESWHREVLPAFLGRVAQRLGGACLSGHQAVRPRADRDREDIETVNALSRADLFSSDVRAAESPVDSPCLSTGRRDD